MLTAYRIGCVVNFDNMHTLAKGVFHRRVAGLSPARLAEACQVLAAVMGLISRSHSELRF